MQNNFGLIFTFCPESGVVCSDDKCGRLIKMFDKCFIDPDDSSVYCESCGQCLRYERKMAAKRAGENV